MDPNGREMRYVEDMKIVKNKRKQILAGNHKSYSDKDFPMEIGIEAAHDRQVHWKRIPELDNKPRLFAEPNSLAGSMEVGLLEDHNFLAVLTALWNHKKLLDFVFPPGQDFDSPEYCGFFYFRFWKMGKWVYVIVDDKLPVLGKKVEDAGKKKTPKKKDGSGQLSLDGVDAKGGSKIKAGDSSKTIDESEAVQPGDVKIGSKSKLEDSSKKTDGTESPQNLGGSENRTGSKSKLEDSSKKTEAAGSPQDPTKSSNNDDKTDKPTEDEPKGDAKESEAKKANGNVQEPSMTGKPNVPQGKEDTQKLDSPSNASASKKGKTEDLKSPETNTPGDEDTKKASHKPIFVRVVGAQGEHYYWASLFEKAYAKLCGGYHLMARTGIVETLLDLTGGIIEVFYTQYLPKNFFLSLKHHSDNRSIILATSTMPKKNDEEDKEDDDKNVEGAFYAVTQTVFADFQKLLGLNKMMGFVRLRNPSGALEWENNWMEAAQEWEMLPAEVHKKLGMVSNDAGEFYLTYDNFLKAYSSLIISTVSDGDNFNCEGYFGIWTRPRLKYNLCNLPGLRFHEFPQHKIWVRDPNCDDNLFVEVLISLSQSGNCCCSDTPCYVGMMFFLFCLEPGRTYTPPLNFSFFRYNKPIGSSNYSTEKEVSGRFNLPSGHYLVVAVPDHSNIVHPCLTNDYLLRVVTPSKFPKPPPPHMAVTFCESENMNIYFDFAEVIEEPKVVVPEKKGSNQRESRANLKDKGGKGRKKKAKH